MGVSQDLFCSTIIIEQGLPINFTQMTKTVRKGVVEDLLGFNVRSDFYKPLIDHAKIRKEQ